MRDCQSLPRVMARMDREMPRSEGPREELAELPYRAAKLVSISFQDALKLLLETCATRVAQLKRRQR